MLSHPGELRPQQRSRTCWTLLFPILHPLLRGRCLIPNLHRLCRTTTTTGCTFAAWTADPFGVVPRGHRHLFGYSTKLAATLCESTIVGSASHHSQIRHHRPRKMLLNMPWFRLGLNLHLASECRRGPSSSPTPLRLLGCQAPYHRLPPGSEDDESEKNFAAQYLQPSDGDEEFMGTRQDDVRRVRYSDEMRDFTATTARVRRRSDTPSSTDPRAP
eukprot:579086-Pleurochrysis_carterae.AAC.5